MITPCGSWKNKFSGSECRNNTVCQGLRGNWKSWSGWFIAVHVRHKVRAAASTLLLDLPRICSAVWPSTPLMEETTALLLPNVETCQTPSVLVIFVQHHATLCAGGLTPVNFFLIPLRPCDAVPPIFFYFRGQI